MMKKLLLINVAVVISLLSKSQTIDFENFSNSNLQPLAIDTFWNGSDESGDFIFDGLEFTNNYDTNFHSWNGFAVSTMRDTMTSGFANQYSAMAKSHNTYLVAYQFGNNLNIKNAPSTSNNEYVVNSVKIANTFYAYHSMKNGDSYAKKFGSDTNASGMIDGTDGKDWFKLEIIGKRKDPNNGLIYIDDTTEFYLADFRDSDSNNHYIIDDWTTVPLNSLVIFDTNQITFKLTSSDNGMFGMNTPAYFALDDLVVSNTSSIEDISSNNFKIYPNPTNNYMNIESITYTDNTNLNLYSINGKLLQHFKFNGYNQRIDLSFLKSGMYLLEINNGQSKIIQKIIKN